MKPEPLKNKEFEYKIVPYGWHIFEKQDIKLAVEWLEKEDYKIYNTLKSKLQPYIGNYILDIIHSYFLILIKNKNKAFEDVITNSPTESKDKK